MRLQHAHFVARLAHGLARVVERADELLLLARLFQLVLRGLHLAR